MISPSFKISEFFDNVKDKSYLDIIYLSDQEATKAERLAYRSRNQNQPLPECVLYAHVIKDFICYLRYGVLTQELSKENAAQFISIGAKLRGARKRVLDS